MIRYVVVIKTSRIKVSMAVVVKGVQVQFPPYGDLWRGCKGCWSLLLVQLLLGGRADILEYDIPKEVEEWCSAWC